MSKTRKRNLEGARARAAAALAVDLVLTKGRTLDSAFADVLNDALTDQERSQIKALAFGALRWHPRHRVVIGQLLDRPLRARDRILESLLSVGLFELVDGRQPGYAIVSATVEASRQLKRPRAAGLINAALRRFQRESNELLSQALGNEEARFNYPQWLITRLRDDWPDHWQQILEAALLQPPLWLRVNTAKSDPKAYAELLAQQTGVAATPQTGVPDALQLERALSVSELPGFDEGLVSVQDAAAQLAADLLGATPGMRVLDACAAPGGKSLHLLERCDGDLHLLAVDIDAARNELVTENLRRVGYAAEVLTADVCDIDAWAPAKTFDRILIDAPCSATGVIRRHPDIKYLRRSADIDVLVRRQTEMLEALWPLLAPGGRLLYATCSVLRAENDHIITKFLAAHSDACEMRALDTSASSLVTDFHGPGYQLLPGPANTDGFYYALMERKA